MAPVQPEEERQDLLREEERAPEVGEPYRPRPPRSIPLFGVAVVGLCVAIIGVAVWLRDSKTAQRLESEASDSLNLRGRRESKEPASEPTVAVAAAGTDSGDGDDGGDGDDDGDGEVDKEPGTAHIYFVGDSHADFNYLTRALLSTGHFNLVNGKPDWKRRDGGEDEDWEIVITGDVLDKGSLPWKSLTLIKRLQEEWPGKLTFLLGNQEVWNLLGNKKYLSEGDNPPSDWSKADRLGNLTAAEGTDGYGLVSWLLEQPVIHLKSRVLTMHGGMSENMYNKLRAEPQVASACEAPGKVCGDAMVELVNGNSTEYFKSVHECMIAAAGTDAIYKCDDPEKRPYWLAAESNKGTKHSGTEGVTVFRGYSENNKIWDAGSEASCLEAKTVGKGLGAQILNVAHTMHEYSVRQLCKDPDDDDTVIVYNLDTSWKKCARLPGYKDYPNSTGECDLGVNHIFHDPHKVGRGYGETQPSSLHIKFNLGYPVFREIKACSSAIAENLDFSINCTSFSDGSS